MFCDHCHKKIKGIGMMMPTAEKEKVLCMDCADKKWEKENGKLTLDEMAKMFKK